MNDKSSYLGNLNLKSANVPIQFTQDQIEEYIKCSQNPNYFIEKYIKIINVDKGLVPFQMYEFQKKIVQTVHDNRFTIAKLPRQSGKSTTIVSYILYYILFNPSVNVGILANKQTVARDLLSKIKTAYQYLPKWMQQGVGEWNKSSIILENGSRVIASATSSSAIRGGSFNLILLDEFAFIPPNIAEEFFSSAYPTISSGQTTKVVIVSTPKGLNMFYKLWAEAEEKRNEFIPIEVQWSDIPGRDIKWKEQQIRNTSEEQFKQEFESLASETNIIINNKETTLGDVYNDLLVSNPNSVLSNHKQLKVLTPSGNQLFSHIQKFTRKGYIHIQFRDGTELKVSPKHPFIVNGTQKLAHDLNLSDIIDGERKDIFHIDFVDEEIELFDLLNVENGNLYLTNGIISHNCDFIGSSNTLISSSKLKTLTFKTPIYKDDNGLKVYEEPIAGHSYVMTVDCSRGNHLDYHAFVVIDITKIPYRVVATFRNNEISPMVYPNVIYPVAKKYNEAFILVEINDIGGQVADLLYNELEYDNVLVTSVRGRKGQTLDGGFGASDSQLGIRTTKAVKRLGCSLLKSFVEDDKLVFQDYDIVQELVTFVYKNRTYEADSGNNDDLIMCMVIFCWLSTQNYFKDLANMDIRKQVFDEKIKQLEEDMTPFGFIQMGTDPDVEMDDQGNGWTLAQDWPQS